MNRVFTEYVRSLAVGGTPSPELVNALLEKLHGALRAEMRKRGLWSTSPAYLGIHGRRSWTQDDAFDELVNDAFVFLLARLPGVNAQLRRKDNVEGFFFRGIRNFLYDTQKRHDPLGFRVFTVTQSAVRQGIEDGTLHVLEGDPGVKNDTVLGFAPGGDPKDAHAGLEEHVKEWDDELMPDLVDARGKGVDGVFQRLAVLISGLPDAGIEVFAFHDLVGLMKNNVRRRWNAIWEQQAGEMAHEGDGEEEVPDLVLKVPPDSGAEDREGFDKLLVCVSERISELNCAHETRNHLDKLWRSLKIHAAEEEPSADTKASKMPSKRQIARTLKIPRDRLNGLLETLGEVFKECRAAISDNRQLRR